MTEIQKSWALHLGVIALLFALPFKLAAEAATSSVRTESETHEPSPLLYIA